MGVGSRFEALAGVIRSVWAIVVGVDRSQVDKSLGINGR